MKIFCITLLFNLCLHTIGQNAAFDWARTYTSSPGNTFANAITVDANGNVITTGFFHGTVDFDPGPSIFTMSTTASNGSDYDVYVTKMDPAGNFLWASQLGGFNNDAGTALTTDAAGNIFMTGFFRGLADFDPGPGVYNLSAWGQRDVFIVKLNSTGGLQWAKSFYGQGDDEGRSICLDVSGNILSTGLYKGDTDFDPGAATYTMTTPGNATYFYVSKLDNFGNFVWAKNVGEMSTNQESRGIVVDATGNTYITGFFMGAVDFDPSSGNNIMNSSGSFDAFLLKLNPSGGFVFSRAIGGSSQEKATAITLAPNGDVLMTGFFEGTAADFDPGVATFTLSAGAFSSDIFICRLSGSGGFVWAVSMGGYGYEEGASIACDASGNVYTTGAFMSANTDFDPAAPVYNLDAVANDAFVSKIDPTGTFVWAKQIGGGSLVEAHSIAVDAAGAVYSCGHFLGNVDFDPGFAGHLISTSFYHAYVHKLTECAPSQTVSLSASVNLKLCIGASASLTVLSSGTVSWTAGTAATSIITMGNSLTTTTLSPGTYWYYAISGGTCPAMLPVSVTVNPLPVISIGNTVVCIGNTVVIAASGADTYTWSTGSLSPTIEISPMTLTIYTVIGQDSHGCSGTGSLSIQPMPCTGIITRSVDEMTIYPNPFSSVVIVKLTSWQTAFIEICDALGSVIARRHNLLEYNSIDLTIFPAGMYYVKVVEDCRMLMEKKLVKE